MDDNVIATTPELIDMIGARFETVARMGTGEADTVLFRTSMAAGKVVPFHSHIDPECFYVLSGRIEVFVGDDKPGWHAVETGRSLLVANGVRHAVRNPANQPADMILATNTRLARFSAKPVGRLRRARRSLRRLPKTFSACFALQKPTATGSPLQARARR